MRSQQHLESGVPDVSFDLFFCYFNYKQKMYAVSSTTTDCLLITFYM